VLVPQATFSSSLQHLRLDNRLIIRTQDEIDHLAGLLSQFKEIKFLSLFLSSRSAGTDKVLSLDPLFDALNQLSRKTPQRQEADPHTGLQILCVQWADLFHAHQAVVSADVLEKLLLYQLDSSESISTICKLRLCGLYLGSAHLEAVAKALRGNVVLEDLSLSGHNRKHGSVTSSCLQAILEVLKNQNHTLMGISVYSSNKAKLCHHDTLAKAVSQSNMPVPTSASPFHHDIYTSVGSTHEEDNHAACCRLQKQMEIFCHLNRLGRATLVSPNASSNDWVSIITRCTADVWKKTADSRNSSSLVSRVNNLLDDDYSFKNKTDEDMQGLDKVFLLLQTYPSFFYVSDRLVFYSSVPPDFELLCASFVEGSLFKNCYYPYDTVEKALAMNWTSQYVLKEHEL